MLDLKFTYKVTVFYTTDEYWMTEKASDKLYDFLESGVEVIENMSGGSCFDPYITVESESKDSINKTFNNWFKYCTRYAGFNYYQ